MDTIGGYNDATAVRTRPPNGTDPHGLVRFGNIRASVVRYVLTVM